MSETPQPFLAYTRIEANRRKTRLLLASFALVLLPVLSAGAVWLMPWVTLIGGAIGYAVFGQKLIAILDSWQREIAAKLPAEGTLGTLDLPAPVLLIEGGLLLVALVMTVMALVGLTSFLISRYGSRAVLRQASARPVGREQEPDLVRIVENLCIGTGLPLPSIHLVESPAPNAFATGNDPQHATLVVTRGLLTLLNRRELEGVIGHELSHIGNHDIRLNTVLAALVGTMTLPFRMCEALFRPAFRLHWTVGACATWMAVTLCLSFAHLFAGFAHMAEGEFSARIHPFLWWWTLHSLTAPVYAVFVAPVLALLIRRAVSRQREFLADSDATLLTRDPEGLLLALVKIGAAGGERLEIGEGSVHLCIVDPHPPNRGSVSIASLLHRLFPSHPPLKERIELLARMGSGIAPAALEAALQAGAKARGTRPEPVDAPAAEPDLQPDAVPSFTDVETRAGTYVPPATAVAISPDPAGGPTLTPLYERPDGWSRVLARLPHDAPVTAIASEGHFVQVSTRENLLGYVARSAPLAALSALERTADAGSWKS